MRHDMRANFRDVETLELQKARGYFADQWDPQPGNQTPSGPEAKSYYLRRFVLRWVAEHTEISLFYGDEETTRDEARLALLKLATSLRPVNPSEELAGQWRTLIDRIHR
jgi:hypothetical protein